MPRAVLALDQGTTSSRAILFDGAGTELAVAQEEFPQRFPQPGWVEHDPEAIWQSQHAVIGRALLRAGIDWPDIAAIGITNQRETTLLWDRHTGEPLGNAIVWQDRRTADLCERLRAEGHEGWVQARTGLLLDPYFSGTKLRWMLDHREGARDRAERGELAFGTVDSWLIWRLTEGRVHATDASNASRTLLYNLHTGDWDDDLLALFDIPRAVLPEIHPSRGVMGTVSGEGFPSRTPIAGVAGDQQAALFGQNCTVPGWAKATYGTGAFVLMNTGATPVPSDNGLLSTLAWRAQGADTFALEGSVFVAGALVQWLRDGLGILRSADEVERLAESVPDAGGVVIVPAFVGLGAPRWDPDARGTILGITRGTTAAHIARAALEAIAFQIVDVVRAMEGDAGESLRELRVDGGAARNNLLLQIQADLLGVPVVRPWSPETTALGAAYHAGLAVGFWEDEAQIASQWQAERVFEPKGSRDEAAARQAQWERAVGRATAWARNEA